MARVLYMIGTLAVIGSALWLFEVVRATGIPRTNLEYQVIAWAAAIPVSVMLGGVLIIAFGVVLARLNAIQYASELSGDALAEIAGRDRGLITTTGSSLGPFPSSADSASSATKSPVGRAARAAQPSDHVASQTQEAATALAVTMASIKKATAADSPVRAQATPMKRDGSSSAKPLPSLAAMKAALNAARDVSRPVTPTTH